MIVLLSPAKSLKETEGTITNYSEPRLMTQSWALVKVLRTMKYPEIMDLMHISENLATTNVKRYKTFKRKHTELNSKTAIETFDGDVYKGLNAESFDTDDLFYAQDHVRILSGLYGILRPLDLMQAYRLEMGTTLATDAGTNLYHFWGDKITKLLNKDLKASGSDLVVNLASNEYFKAVQTKQLKGKLLNINFKEYRDGQLKFISFNAKKARGLMTHYIVKNKIEDLEGLKGFNLENYAFDEEGSTENDWLFVR